MAPTPSTDHTSESDLLAEIRALRSQLAQATPAPRPLTTWRAVAEALGVSVHTVMRRRRQNGDHDTTRRPYFVDVEAARAWFADLVTSRNVPVPPVRVTKVAPPKPSTPKAPTGGTTLADMLEAKKRKRGGGAA
jgi:hypothetical protein